MLMTMLLADKLEIILFRHLRRIHVTILMRSLETLTEIRNVMLTRNITLSNLEFAQAVEGQGISMTCFLRLHRRTIHQEAIAELEKIPGVIHVEQLDI